MKTETENTSNKEQLLWLAKFYMLTPLLVTQGSSWSCDDGGGGGAVW